jgi:uncharacterized Zn finger protein (UPF0148 family)
MSSDDSSGRIKYAASVLLKGGTLTSEACPRCGGVQVRFAEKVNCINCGNEVKTSGQQKPESGKAVPTQSSAGLESTESIIREKIVLLAAEIKLESDILMQKQKAELLETYLRILEKTKSLMR